MRCIYCRILIHSPEFTRCKSGEFGVSEEMEIRHYIILINECLIF